MRQNAEDNGKRKFIMVQVPQLCADGTVAKSKDTQIFVKSQKNVSAVLVRKLKRIVL